MNSAYMIYQAERTKTGAEQHEIDASNAMLVHSLSWLWRFLAAPLRFRHRARHGGEREAQQGTLRGIPEQALSCLAALPRSSR